MKLSVYTFVQNGLFYDFHVAAMLRHHLPLAEEIIVNEGYSTDGTYEAISSIDPKIRVHRFVWDRSDPNGWHRAFKNQARRLCTGDWCVLLDCDEFIPEWEFDRLRAHMAATDKHVLTANYKHFYGNYKVVYDNPARPFPPREKRIAHRNRPDVEVYGDGSDVRMVAMGADAEDPSFRFDVHHFGEVRKAARLRQKWRVQAKQHNAKDPKWDKMPSVLFDMFPHKWDDGDLLKDLSVYEGPYVQAVRDDPGEFVRDDFWLYDRLKAGASSV